MRFFRREFFRKHEPQFVRFTLEKLNLPFLDKQTFPNG